jgi:hypothetical protein
MMPERSNRARMFTYTPKMGDVVKWPNGVEMNYDASTESVVVLHPNERAVLTVRPEETPQEQAMVLSKGIWLLGRDGSKTETSGQQSLFDQEGQR